MVINIKKLYFPLLIVFISAIIAISIFTYAREKAVFSSSNLDEFCIVIDAGHGGQDGGAVSSDGVYEKNLNLDIAKKLKELFLLSGYKVIMTREDDVSTDDTNNFNKRKDIINRVNIINAQKNAILISVHINKFPQSKYSGAQMFYSAKSQQSKQLAETIQDIIKSSLQQKNNRLAKPIPNSVYLFNKVNLTAVLAECGFLSNADELSLLKTDEYKQKMAICLYLGTVKYLSL